MISRTQIKTMGKAQLMELIHGVGRQAAREIINVIIAENRKVPLLEAKKKKMVLAHEVKKVLDYFGFEITD
ncbi:hypothetical protein KORDIASMS9_02263 [Kordia sp. SMS9]|uniref:hypothetical protein n=1 Tax=Kordia sp. SMS9 TaxID=2282170 RepID=UPI000E0D9D7B|nr:hypothetical protein [Kordia sp. SMS9]AXG70034.1 hypothetical protein KORDIASMS9_02263 [Kordia sp. SMS9]